MGRAGRNAITGWLPVLRKAWALDFVVVNGENATGGAGLSPDHAKSAAGGGRRLPDTRRSCLRPTRHARVLRAGTAHHPAPEYREIGARRAMVRMCSPTRAGGVFWWRRHWAKYL